MLFSPVGSEVGGKTDRGFTLVEVLVAMVIATAILAASFALVAENSEMTSMGTTVSATDARARRALDRITVELMGAGRETLDPATPDGGSTLSFRTVMGSDSDGQPIWGPLKSIAFEYDDQDPGDDIDNNENGAVDEGRVVWTPDTSDLASKVTWARDVGEHLEGEIDNGADDNGNGLIDEGGLAFSLNGKTLTIRLTIQGIHSRQLISRTLETSLTLRN